MLKWTELRQPELREGNNVAVVSVGTTVWLVLFLVQLPFYGWFADRGHEWWVWSCSAGVVLGLFGLWFVKRLAR